MGLHLFNTLNKKTEGFTPLDPAGRGVGVYSCGPTVYDFAHIGNFRTFVFSDLVRRYLEFRGFDVRHVMNITDVDDKIIAKVNSGQSTHTDFTRGLEKSFFEDMATLGCLQPHYTPRATEHIGDIIELIKRLFENGLAYQAADGSVYFSIKKYIESGHRYGQLVNLDLDQLRPGERTKHDEYAKDSIADFALWKARTAEDGEIYWRSPWGEGRPGWHIECSAMSMKILGSSIDIHIGGEDLIFPHHEDEIAQSEGACGGTAGQPFVRYWLHAAHLFVEGKKMSKSLGNFFTLRDLTAQGFSGREIRYLLLSGHYRETFNFTIEGLHGARSAIARLEECILKLKETAGAETAVPEDEILASFTKAMDDDLNVSAAWGAVFDWIREKNRQLAENELSPQQAASALAAWEKINSVFGIPPALTSEIPQEIIELAENRQAARKARDFETADRLRDRLKAEGWIVEDTPKGPRLKPID